MNGITTRKDGRRIYVEGKTFDIKDRLKAMGGHWDPGKKAWWVSSSKEADLAELLDAAAKDAEKPRYGQTFVADIAKGVCAKCGKPVIKGQYARYRYPEKALEHEDCERAAAAAAKMEARKQALRAEQEAQRQTEKAAAPYRLSGGSGYGCHGWQVGQTMMVSEDRREKGWPEFVTVAKAGRRYFREDGMSFGVGDDQGYIYSADCREATPEEIAPVKARIEAAEAVKTAKAEVEAIKKRIKAEGERPDGDNIPEGDLIFDTQTIYGGGDWFVVGPEWIWYVQNNGGDGDDWGENNVHTGGAGAIGWRVPHSRDIAGDLYRLEGIVDPDGAKKRTTEKTVAALENVEGLSFAEKRR
ncbi:MAG: hypothetical protein WCR92_09255, partial [Candidatus Cloacimonadaceae bacterium]